MGVVDDWGECDRCYDERERVGLGSFVCCGQLSFAVPSRPASLAQECNSFMGYPIGHVTLSGVNSKFHCNQLRRA
ncbi:hypothetical protein AX14_009712 [Amanita brunnescens Koide BX004]|nr:hypothetical protein AX14_009712 [Amanita brunnescens Koide BX004]